MFGFAVTHDCLNFLLNECRSDIVIAYCPVNYRVNVLLMKLLYFGREVERRCRGGSIIIIIIIINGGSSSSSVLS